MAEVASAYVTLLPSAQGFGAKTSRELSGPLDKAGRTGGRRFGGGMAAGLAGMGTRLFAPLAAAAAAVGVGSFFKEAVAGASDLNESSTKIQAIFGKASGAVNQFADQGAKALGQTKLQVLDAAASFGTFGKAAGLQGPELAKFSTGLAGLSTDLASFFNTSPEEAAQAISAGLRGEAEPLRQYGVLLDDASLRQEALKQGLIKTTKQALTPQQKVLAAQALIYKQTKDAQGDFARTSGGLANQQRILAASFANFKTSVGKALLPVVLKVVTGLNSLGPVFKRIGQFLAPVKEAFVVFFEAIKGGEVTTIGPLGRIGDAAYALRDAFFQVLPKVQALFTQVVGIVTTRVLPAVKLFAQYVIANAVPILQTLGQIVVTKIVPAFLAVAGFIYGKVYPALVAIVVAVASRLKPVLDQLFATVQARLIPVIQLIAAKFQQWWPTIQKVVTFVVKLLGWVLKLAASILGKVLPVVIKFAGFLLTVVVKALIGVIEFVAKVIGWIIKLGTGVVGAVRKFLAFERGVRAVLQRVVRFFIELPGKIVSALGNAGSTLKDTGVQLVTGLWEGIKSMGSWLTGKILAFAREAIPGPLRKFFGIHSPSRYMAREVGRWLPLGLAKGIDSTSKSAAQAAERMAKVIAGRLGAAEDKLKQLTSARSDYIKGLRDSIAGTATITSIQIDNGEISTQSLLERLRSQAYQVRKFAAQLVQLRRLGLSNDQLQSIANDRTNGSAIASALLAGGKSAIREANRLNSQVLSAARSGATAVGDAMYRNGINSAKGLIDGLKAGRRALMSVASGLGSDIVKAIKKALGIHSPSRVMAREVGRWIPLGLVKGIDSQAGAVRSSMTALTGSVVRPQVSPSIGGGADAAGGLRLHPHDIALLADAMAARPTVLDGRRVSKSQDRALAMGVRP